MSSFIFNIFDFIFNWPKPVMKRNPAPMAAKYLPCSVRNKFSVTIFTFNLVHDYNHIK